MELACSASSHYNIDELSGMIFELTPTALYISLRRNGGKLQICRCRCQSLVKSLTILTLPPCTLLVGFEIHCPLAIISGIIQVISFLRTLASKFRVEPRCPGPWDVRMEPRFHIEVKLYAFCFTVERNSIGQEKYRSLEEDHASLDASAPKYSLGLGEEFNQEVLEFGAALGS
ncbi:hypothetical protein Peur_002021 [Populus x canadensis]